MKRMNWILAALLATSLAACGGDDDGGGGADAGGGGGGFTQPTGTVVVNFIVDDSVNKDWKAGELEWKGQLQVNPTTRVGTFNSDWLAQTPGWTVLYDDGPWNAGTPAGHEPAGATKGDNKWGVAVFVAPPATGSPDISVSYGLRDATNPDRANGGWVWLGADPGSFKITPTTTGAVNAPGQTFPAKGTVDLKLVLDKSMVATATPPFTTNVVKVKGSGWGWSEKATFDDGATHGDDTAGDGKLTFVLSLNIDKTKPPYPGLLKSGDKPEWVFVLDGVEYKIDKNSSKAGVTAFAKAGTATTWTPLTIGSTAMNEFGTNTTVTIP